MTCQLEGFRCVQLHLKSKNHSSWQSPNYSVNLQLLWLAQLFQLFVSSLWQAAWQGRN